MTDALQRTVRRCTALLLLPACLVVVQFHRFLDYAHGGELDPVFTLGIPIALLGASVLYLAWSFLVSGAGGPAPIDTD